jgi:hypothetical protein
MPALETGICLEISRKLRVPRGSGRGLFPAGVGLFPPAKFSPGPARISPGADKDTDRTISLSLMTMADVGLIPLDRSYRDPWRALCLAIVMEAPKCSISVRKCWIGLGLFVELSFGGKRVITSRVRSISCRGESRDEHSLRSWSLK